MRRFYFFIFILNAIFFVGVIANIVLQKRAASQGSSPISTQTSLPIHRVRFFEEYAFLQGLDGAKRSPVEWPIGKKIKGGITPHHLLPGTILSRFFGILALQPSPTILILGPNHYELGQFPVLTSRYAWETPFGIVEPDLETMDKLLKSDLIEVDEEVVLGDHSVTGSIPYIKSYLPQTKVIPLLISNKLSLDQIDELTQNIVDALPADTLIIAPVDFSHYLNSTQAEAKDKVTWEAIEKRNYQKIQTFNNDFVDAPDTITLFLKLMDQYGAKETTMLDHTNSGRLLNTPNVETTSYFSVVFSR